eukprot:2901908-Pleurochrysis_carterae.AAC.3
MGAAGKSCRASDIECFGDARLRLELERRVGDVPACKGDRGLQRVGATLDDLILKVMASSRSAYALDLARAAIALLRRPRRLARPAVAVDHLDAKAQLLHRRHARLPAEAFSGALARGRVAAAKVDRRALALAATQTSAQPQRVWRARRDVK